MTPAIPRRPLLLPALAVALLLAALLAAQPSTAAAHPLGNFTVNRYSRIELYSNLARVHYVLDMAEIPAFQEMDSIDTDGDGTVGAAEANAYAANKAAEIARNITLTLDDDPVTLTAVAQNLTFPEGQASLDTLRLTVVFEAGVGQAGNILYMDGNYIDRLGWKEIVVDPSTGASLSADAPTQDVSGALTKYPEDLLSSPADVSRVQFDFDASGAHPAPPIGATTLAGPAEGEGRGGGGFASLIDQENMTLPVVLLALLSALAFGAVHALEPGHGKTLVAAYFVGVKGDARHALALGGIVAATHSIGVFAIGLVTIFASQWVLPETLYPWLSLASGVMVLLLGLRLIAARGGIAWLRRAAHRLLPHRHRHEHGHESHAPDGPPPWRSLFVLGLVDGLTPSPSALVVLLAAISLDRIELGIGLIVAFSIGLAAVLTAVAVGLAYTRSVANRLSVRLQQSSYSGRRLAGLVTLEGAVMRLLPVGGALALVVVGLWLTTRALSGAGLAVL